MNLTSQDQDELTSRARLAALFAIGSLWLHLYFTIHPTWIASPYHEYAWFVPPLAIFLFYRRWEERKELVILGSIDRLMVAGAVLLFPFLVVVRIFGEVDELWRLPMTLYAGVVTCATLVVLNFMGGRTLALKVIPVVVFALSAIPLPSFLETSIINGLTNLVVESSGKIFQLLGKQVDVVGGVIQYYGTKVEVTEGCSGIQSFQSLVMVSLYFGEFFRLRIPHRFFIIATACVVSIVVNIGRAVWLAQVRFTRGEEAFNGIHDQVGHIAFVVGSLIIFVLSHMLTLTGYKKTAIRQIRHTPKER
ncbi:exosortase/archaeosortase family protein [Akkermansiaceae bacterium]|nr:exosortase/archaeosortase family protein [Akkermansiaceae bacterium]MDB4658979.1 exosortase/archaeosortase family protein [bacterium]